MYISYHISDTNRGFCLLYSCVFDGADSDYLMNYKSFDKPHKSTFLDFHKGFLDSLIPYLLFSELDFFVTYLAERY